MSTSGADHGIDMPTVSWSLRLRDGRRDAEVGEHRMSVRGHQDVARLDVAVQHARAMRGLDRAADLDRDAQHLGHRDALRPVARAQRRRAELHDEVGATVGRDARLVDGEDRRMRRELGHEVGLGLEHLPHLLVDDLAEHDFDRHLAPRHVLLVQEDIGETTRSQDVHVRETG